MPDARPYCVPEDTSHPLRTFGETRVLVIHFLMCYEVSWSAKMLYVWQEVYVLIMLADILPYCDRRQEHDQPDFDATKSKRDST